MAVAAQLALLLATWTGTAPTDADRTAGDQYVARLRSIDGDVLNWHERFIQTRTGKTSRGLEMAAEDVLRSSDRVTAEALKADVIRACASGAVAGVMDPPDWLQAAVAFGPPIEMFPNSEIFKPIAGVPKRPARYYPLTPAGSSPSALPR